MMTVNYLTPQGYENLINELEYLRTQKRAEIAQRLKEVFEEGGNLAENVAYDFAREEQSFIEGRINELEHILAFSRIIEHPGVLNDTIQVGSTVVVSYSEDEEATFTIVGPAETNPGKGLISLESPLGRALIGHRPGDTVEVRAPDGKYFVRIIYLS